MGWDEHPKYVVGMEWDGSAYTEVGWDGNFIYSSFGTIVKSVLLFDSFIPIESTIIMLHFKIKFAKLYEVFFKLYEFKDKTLRYILILT